MERADFLRKLQTARNVFFSQLVALENSDPIAQERSEQDWNRLKVTAPIWMSPQVVAGFDPADFSLLLPDRLEALSDGVAKFRAIAEATHGREPTTKEMNAAIQLFVAITSAIDLALPEQEGKAVHVALFAAKKPFPDFVLGVDYTLGEDAAGDEAIWIWVLVPDNIDPDSLAFREFASRFRRAVWSALGKVKSPRIPYIHYRPMSEALETLTAGAA